MSRAPNRHAYIHWQESDEQGEMIIDEQHRAIVATINSFYYFLSQGYDVQELKPTLELLLKYMLFHLKTEEGILHTTEYPYLSRYAEIQKSTIAGLKEAINNATQFKQPDEVLVFLKNWWLSHLKEHEAITPFCHDWSGEYCHVPE